MSFSLFLFTDYDYSQYIIQYLTHNLLLSCYFVTFVGAEASLVLLYVVFL